MPAAAMMEQEMSTSADADLAQAEELLHCGLWDSARAAATKALAGSDTTPKDLTRALYVMLQADFQQNMYALRKWLTPLELVAAEYGHKVQELPVSVILLWGIIAIELKQLPLARQLLASYVAANKATGLSQEDALALSRLFAVRVMTEACGDGAGARTWLQAGGACLAQEQQQLLLKEVEEAESSNSHSAVTTSATPPTGQRAAGAAAVAAAAAAGTAFADSDFCTMLGEPCEEGQQQDGDQLPDDGNTQAPANFRRQAAAAAGRSAGAAKRDGAAGDGWVGSSTAWVQGRAASWWNSPIVQETLQRLHMEELTPLQLAGGTAAAAVLGYAVWRERKGIQRAAASAAVGLTAGVAQTVGMALGFAPNAMTAVPSGQYS